MKKHLLLLHGAAGSQEQFDGIAEVLNPIYTLHRFNFSGHGGQPFSAGFSLQQFTDELLDYIAELPDEMIAEGLYVFGYSMGGYVAAMAALQRPGCILRIATLATKWHWDETSASKEAMMLNPELIEEKVPIFAKLLANRHAPNDWKELLRKIAQMMIETGQRPPVDAVLLSQLQAPALLMVGDRDKTVTIEETLNFYKAWPGASMAVLPSTPHSFEKVNEPLLVKMLIDFFPQ